MWEKRNTHKYKQPEKNTGNDIQEEVGTSICPLGIMVNPQMINKSVDANDGSTLTLILLNKGDSK